MQRVDIGRRHTGPLEYRLAGAKRRILEHITLIDAEARLTEHKLVRSPGKALKALDEDRLLAELAGAVGARDDHDGGGIDRERTVQAPQRLTDKRSRQIIIERQRVPLRCDRIERGVSAASQSDNRKRVFWGVVAMHVAACRHCRAADRREQTRVGRLGVRSASFTEVLFEAREAFGAVARQCGIAKHCQTGNDPRDPSYHGHGSLLNHRGTEPTMIPSLARIIQFKRQEPCHFIVVEPTRRSDLTHQAIDVLAHETGISERRAKRFIRHARGAALGEPAEACRANPGDRDLAVQQAVSPSAAYPQPAIRVEEFSSHAARRVRRQKDVTPRDFPRSHCDAQRSKRLEIGNALLV